MKTRKATFALLTIISAFALFFLNSCLDDENMSKAERRMIDLYIKALGDTVYEKKASGLYYIELVPGTGPTPVAKDTVVFRGRGMFLDYTVFSSSMNTANPEVYVIGSGEKIPGIDEGLRYMKAGGKSRLLTPSYLAYSTSFGYNPLLWEITLISIKKGP
jgi:FKBP-type peptidyl-prolyl cis-trans isomerase